jgi:hypothetical protein
MRAFIVSSPYLFNRFYAHRFTFLCPLHVFKCPKLSPQYLKYCPNTLVKVCYGERVSSFPISSKYSPRLLQPYLPNPNIPLTKTCMHCTPFSQVDVHCVAEKMFI